MNDHHSPLTTHHSPLTNPLCPGGTMQPQPASWPVRRIAWWALIAVAAVLWQGRGLLQDLRPPGDAVVDFYQEWASARNFRSGDPIYEPQRESSQRYLGATPATQNHFFLEVNAH